MKKLKIGITNRIYLDTEKTVDEVKISILKRDGAFLKTDAGTDIDELDCTPDAEIGKYKCDINFHSETVPDYYTIVWSATYSGINVSLEDELSPEDILIEKRVAADTGLVLPSFVMDHHLRGIDVSIIESKYNDSYRNALRREIKNATEELESLTEVYFTPRLIEGERHDYDMTPIYEKYWTNTLFHSPIVSVEKVALKLNNIEMIREVPASWVQIGNAKEGTIKVMPYSGGYKGLMFVYTVGVGIAILLAGSSYIPDFFSYDYYAGLDWDNLPLQEKNEIRIAISRRVAISILPNLDVHRGVSSESKSIDGVSKSTSYTSSALYGEHSAAINEFSKQEKLWIQSFKKKYLTRLKIG